MISTHEHFVEPSSMEEMFNMTNSVGAKHLFEMVNNDHGLSQDKKQSLFTMLNTPEIFDHLLVGAGGAALALAVAKFAEMDHVPKVLVGLAGFGIGNVLYNMLSSGNKFTSYNPATGTSTIKV